MLVLALLVLATPASAQAQSLLELHAAARTHDSRLLAARAQWDASLARAAQARAGLLPQAGLAAASHWTQRDSSAALQSGSSKHQHLTLSASQPLLRPVNRLASEQAQLAVEVARAQLDAAEQDLIVRSAQAYFDLLAAQDSLRFVQAQLTAVAAQRAAAQRNFEVGTATITDARETQARLDLVRAQEISTENELLIKTLALEQLVGRSGFTPLPLRLPLVLPALQAAELQSWLDQAETAHPLLRQAALALSIAQLETRRAQAAKQPTLDLLGQVQITRGPAGLPALPGQVRNRNASVGLQFNLPLYSGGALQSRVQETLALEEKARAEQQTTQRSVTQTLRSAFFGVLSGQSQVQALAAAQASSQSALEANQLGYQVGVRINIDVLNAQSQLFQTKRDLALARYNVLLGGLRLRQASGSLEVGDLQALNALLAH
ncbi:TolC family outer membrane protein [Hydrogenophaga sp.]|uniref:TolC family outer membrane protein n=1 Tax=Hydrogenophaga sp. TaxID=1904254 RepID=UPI00198AE3C6|nr:TolC family outer membrane protein [Hydrogenophaga sp.]MBD3892472.1 channel protein TolC [Hydrogenophaga sp.]